MSTKNVTLHDENGNILLPATKTSRVTDANGTNLDTLLQQAGQVKSISVNGVTQTIDANGNVNIASADGVGIASVVQTTTSSEDGGTNVITVTKTDNTTSTFSVKNGSKGNTGAQGPQGERGPQGNTGVTVESVNSIIHSIDPTATYAAADVAGADAVQDVLLGEINIGEKRAVNGNVLYNELREIKEIENIATFVSGGYIKTDGSVGSIGGWYYVDKMDISMYTHLTTCCRAINAGYNILFDEELNILRRWQSGTSPYITEIDLVNDYPSAKYISLTSNKTGNYVNAEMADNTTTREKLAGINNSIESIQASIDSIEKETSANKYKSNLLFDLPISKSSGHVKSDGSIGTGSGVYVQEIDITDYTYIVVYGQAINAAYNVIFDSEKNVLAAKHGDPQTIFDIANDYPTAAYISICSLTTGALAISGIKKSVTIANYLQNISEDYFINRQKIVITKLEGFYNNNRAYNSSAQYKGNKSNIIAVKEGMTFTLTSEGRLSTLNYIMYNDLLQMVSIVRNNTYVQENITIPSGISYIEFFSLNALVVTCEQFQEESDFDPSIGNVLYGKSYVAIGDSFTAPIGSETIESGIYKGQSKVYPYIIGNRNNMAVVNQGASGSVLNWYIATSKYNAIPEDVDYITIWYGINDQGHSISVGTVDDQPETIASETGTTTCGGFNWFFKWLLTNRPFAHVGVIITDYTSQERRAAIISCCQKWGYPYLDLMGDPTIPMLPNGRNSEISVSSEALSLRAAAFNIESGNIHPSNALHEWQSTFIEAFMRRI